MRNLELKIPSILLACALALLAGNLHGVVQKATRVTEEEKEPTVKEEDKLNPKAKISSLLDKFNDKKNKDSYFNAEPIKKFVTDRLAEGCSIDNIWFTIGGEKYSFVDWPEIKVKKLEREITKLNDEYDRLNDVIKKSPTIAKKMNTINDKIRTLTKNKDIVEDINLFLTNLEAKEEEKQSAAPEEVSVMLEPQTETPAKEKETPKPTQKSRRYQPGQRFSVDD